MSTPTRPPRRPDYRTLLGPAASAAAAVAMLAGPGPAATAEHSRPMPLIAPAEPYSPSTVGFDGPALEARCFSPKTPMTDADLLALEQEMRGERGLLRYFVQEPWPSRTITWSFVPDGLSIPETGQAAQASSLFSLLDSHFDSRAQWIGLIQACFDRWEQLSGIDFVRVRYNGLEWDDGAPWDTSLGAAGLRGDIRIGARGIDGQYNTAASCAYPPAAGVTSGAPGNMKLDTAEDWGDSEDSYRYFRNVIIHEIGHGLGLQHVCPKTQSKIMEPILVEAVYGPQHDDMRAAQALYGDVFEPNDSPGTSTPRGAIGGSSSDFLGAAPVPYSSLCSIVPNLDQDWYSYDLGVATSVSVTIDPVGRIYADGPELNCAAATFPATNSEGLQRLTVSLIGSNGATVIQTANAPGLGQSAVLSNVPVPAGRFYVRVGSLTTSSQTQMYLASVTTGAPPRPTNDTCASARAITVGTFNGTNGGADLDGPPIPCGAVFSDVWYSFVPSCDGPVQVNTCGSALDTVISVHAACGGGAIACNDNGSGVACLGPGDSAVTFPAQSGETYLIRVAGRTSTQGVFTLNLVQQPPSNDLCANATALSDIVDLSGSTCGALGNTIASCGSSTNAPDVWYRLVPTCTGTLTLDMCGSDFDTVLSLHTGTCGALTEVLCNDDALICRTGGSPLTSQIIAPVTAGQAYYLRVSGVAGEAGNFNLRGGVGQANDLCDDAATLIPGTITGSLCGARREATSPCAAGSSSPDLYYRYVPQISGVMRLNTCGSDFDTVLEVFTGTCAAPVSAACNNDQGTLACGNGATSRIEFNVTAGTPYLIRLSGAGGATGNFTLRLGQSPGNDLCVDAFTITGGVYTSTTVGAARELYDTCSPTAQAPDVWYRWVAPCNGTARFDTCGSAFDTVLSLHTGANCATLTQVACNDNSTDCGGFGAQASIQTPVTAGTTYWIRVTGQGNSAGTFTLRVGLRNDTCAAGSSVGAGDTAFDTRCATPDGAAPCAPSAGSPDLWYRHVAACTGAVWMSTCSANFDTVLSVSTGDCAALSTVVCNDDAPAGACPANTLASRVVFRASAGTPYLVRIGGYNTASGVGTLSIRCCPADFNLNGVLSVQDIFDFLAGYFAGLPAADFNNSGTISVQDIFDFLAAYFAGCP